MSPASETPATSVDRPKAKAGSRRQNPRPQPQAPPPQDDWLVRDADDRGFETTNQAHGPREITHAPDASSPSTSPPSSSPRWTTSYAVPPAHHARNGSIAQSPSSPVYSPQTHYLQPFSTQSPTASPPGYFISHQSPSPRSARPSSEHYMQNPRFPHHPPPHNRAVNVPAPGAPRPYFRSFDTLEASGHTISTANRNVVLSGYHGHLDVSSVDHRRAKPIARLDVNEDVVLGAKIVPCTSRQDEFRRLRPLVALILYGRPNPSDARELYETAQHGSPVHDHISLHEFHGSGEPYYQTRVEVWSLKEGTHVATLYKSPLVAAPFVSLGQQTPTQLPTGDLTIEAQDNFIIVASGISGEVFVFAPSKNQSELDERFCCIGKFWTSIRKRIDPSSADSRPTPTADDSQPNKPAPILSLSQRWLAIVPPSSPSRHSVQGTVPISPNDVRPPGVESVTAPSPPTSNCNLDIPDPESFTNKMAKGVAKEVVRGAQWVSSQGWQAWQSYWNKSPQANAEQGARTDSHPDPKFPPTHAEHQRAPSEDLDSTHQVSIIDLQHLLRTDSPKTRRKHEPMATFTLPARCSFVSFAPNGLLLLTVSRNGDTQHVWDLLQLGARKLTQKAANNADQPGQSIREVAKFSRFTNASVVDVAWSAPMSDQLAMVTEKGTVHVFKLPQSAFTCPPPRRRGSIEDVSGSKQPQSSSSQQPQMQDTRLPLGQPTTLISAASKVSDTTRPLVATVRRHSTSGVSMLTNNLGDLNMSTSAGLHKSRALAAGVTRHIGAAAGQINQIRRASESRFHLTRGRGSVQPGCLRFLTGNERGYIGAICTESLIFHWIYRSEPASSTFGTSSSGKDSELVLAATAANQHQQDPQPRSFFRPSADETLDSSSADLSSSIHPLASAEIESGASFRPFYTGHRITLSTYKDAEPWDYEPSDADTAPWSFGADIPADAVDLGAERELASDDQLVDAAAAQSGLMGREATSLGVMAEEEPELDQQGKEPESAEHRVVDEFLDSDDDDDEFFRQVPEAGKGMQ